MEEIDKALVNSDKFVGNPRLSDDIEVMIGRVSTNPRGLDGTVQWVWITKSNK